MAVNQIGRLRKKFRQVDLSSLLDECLVETEDILLSLVKSQLEKGETSIGLLSPPLKNDYYAKRKQIDGSKAPFGIPDLKKSGAFQNKFKIKKGKDSLIIRSTDKKAPELLKKYGPEIYELSPDNFEYYTNEILEPLLLEKVNNGLS